MKKRSAEICQKLHKAFSSIRGRILLITISLILFISTIIIFISYFLVSVNLRQNLIQTSETRLSFLCASINSNVSAVKRFTASCRESNEIQAFVREGPADSNRIKRQAHDFAMGSYTSNSSLPSLLIRTVIMGKNRKDIVQIVESPYSSVAVSSDTIKSLPYFESLCSDICGTPAGIVSDPFFATKDIPTIPFVVSIDHPYNAEEVGYIFTEMSASVITTPIRDCLPETDGRLCFLICGHRYRYLDESLLACEDTYEVTKDLSDIALNPDTTIQKVKSIDTRKSFMCITRPIGPDGWYVIEYVDETHLSRNIFHTLFSIVAAVIGASSAIGLLLFRFLSHTVNVPVKLLQERIRRIEHGDFSRDPHTEWEHELGDIGKTINDLSENVLLLMEQRIEDERQKKEYEYRILQSQINPHFLYNTLNSIKWMAVTQNSPGIAEMTTALSRLLKDISKGTSTLVSIGHELSLIQDYFTIQQYRYGGIIRLCLEIEDPTLTSCQILKFTLQPLVENAIFHGIEPKGTTGRILIHIYRDSEDDIHIDVTDDGMGIKPEIVTQLLDSEAPSSSSFFKEVGISNVHRRLKFEFGDRYGLSVKSVEGEYTTVSILLPFRKSEENYDQITDCR